MRVAFIAKVDGVDVEFSAEEVGGAMFYPKMLIDRETAAVLAGVDPLEVVLPFVNTRRQHCVSIRERISTEKGVVLVTDVVPLKRRMGW